MYIETGLWEVRPGNKIRILVNYNDALRPIFWFSLGKDGSVYLGHRYSDISILRKGSKISKDGSVTINYTEGDQIDPESLDDPGKMSFHSSGAVNVLEDRSWMDTLRGITEERTLCLALFKHPSAYESVRHIRKGDIVLNYPFDEERPMLGIITLQPATKNVLEPIRVEAARHQLNLLFDCNGLEMVPADIRLKLVLYHGPNGPWPPFAYLVWRTAGVDGGADT